MSMNNNEIIGVIIVSLSAILGLFFAVRKYERDNKKEILDYIKENNSASNKQFDSYRIATEENTKQLALFNNNFEHMLTNDDKRDEQIKEHGNKLDDHELRLTLVENTKYKKEYTK